MKIYIINGRERSGKDSFCERVQQLMGEHYCHIISTIDPIKHIARQCGWDGEKTPKARKFLSDLKDLTTEFSDYPINYIKKEIERIVRAFEIWDIEHSDACIFIMCREPQEIEKIKNIFGARTICVRRAEAEKLVPSNHADAEVLDYQYDIEVDNNGTLHDLALSVLDFIDIEELHFPHWKNFEITVDGNFTFVN